MKKPLKKVIFKHDTCSAVRGIKSFKCKNCYQEGINYSNGPELCEECRSYLNLCAVCGKQLPQIKFNIYAGLGGGFGGGHYCETDFFDSKEEAENRARELAIEDYESYDGLHGLTDRHEAEEEFREQCNLEEDEEISDELQPDLEAYYMEVVEGWITYWAVPADDDPNWDYERNESNL